MSTRRRLVVLGDSTAFTNGSGPQLPDDPTLYPNVAAGLLARATGQDWAATIVARPGSTVRETYRDVLKDRHLQHDVLLGADAVVIGVCSFDHAPGGVPPGLEAVVPFLRPAAVRRRVRRTLAAAYPVVVGVTRGRLRRTPRAEFERTYDGLLLQVRAWTRGAPAVALGPTSHRSAYYGHRHPLHARAQEEQFAIAARHGIVSEATWPHVLAHLEDLNPDGIHWPAATHRAVGEVVAARLLRQLRDPGTRPVDPLAELGGGEGRGAGSAIATDSPGTSGTRGATSGG